MPARQALRKASLLALLALTAASALAQPAASPQGACTPETDGVVRLLPPEKISKTLKAGAFTKARIVAAEGHDLVGVPI